MMVEQQTRRELRSAEDIRAEVARLVNHAIAAKGATNNTSIGNPMRHPEPDRNGCNWYLSHYSNAGEHLAEVGSALANVKKRWNLKD